MLISAYSFPLSRTSISASAFERSVIRIAQPAQQRAAARCGEPRPLAARERRVRGAHRAIDVGRRTARNQSPGFGAKRIVTLELVARRRVDPVPADVHLVLGERYGGSHGGFSSAPPYRQSEAVRKRAAEACLAVASSRARVPFRENVS
jgi:hypothetical protein